MSFVVTAGADDDGRRLDRIIRKAFPRLPLSAIHRLFRKKGVFVDEKPAGPAFRVAAGSAIRLEADSRGSGPAGTPAHGGGPNRIAATPEADRNLTPAPPEEAGEPEPEILLEKGGLLFLNKPVGIPVHGAGSLDTWVQGRFVPKLPPSLSFRPGPLHRLDKPASGVIVFSLSLPGARYFSALLREGRIGKRYLALVDGVIKKPESWEDDLVRDGAEKKTYVLSPGDRRRGAAGPAKTARTRVCPLAVHPRYTLVLLEIDTGRTHQIRAQAGHHGHPLAGDGKYGGSPQAGGLLLHARSLTLPRLCPEEGQPAYPEEGGTETIDAPIPPAFRRRIRELFTAEQLKTAGFSF
ncbi:MAG: RluA family pseudouridine synthase [Spirochaetaceae bacterium]|jgi:23S rRNA pseudouridine955/2504/2580 synthase|nr:RluA family pseudouridine synthase [Spirochaetaceae bacterium]